LLGPGLFFSFVIFYIQMVGLPERVISPLQGRYAHKGQHKYRKDAHTDILALSGIRTHVPSFRAREDRSCLRPRDHCDRQNRLNTTYELNFIPYLFANLSKLLINVNNLNKVQNICHQMLPSYTENLLELILSDKMTRVKQNQDIRSRELIQRPDNTRVTQRQQVLQHTSVGY
jgi:hypothetical protein